MIRRSYVANTVVAPLLMRCATVGCHEVAHAAHSYPSREGRERVKRGLGRGDGRGGRHGGGTDVLQLAKVVVEVVGPTPSSSSCSDGSAGEGWGRRRGGDRGGGGGHGGHGRVRLRRHADVADDGGDDVAAKVLKVVVQLGAATGQVGAVLQAEVV